MNRSNGPQATLIVDDEEPALGGSANGVWSGAPDTPATNNGTASARNAAPKNDAMG